MPRTPASATALLTAASSSASAAVDHVGGAILLIPGERWRRLRRPRSWSSMHRHGSYTRSMMVAVPIPAPTQRVTSAVLLPRRSSSSSTVPSEHSPGSAERMTHRDGAAVDVGDRGEMPICSMKRRHTDAKASLISKRSMSDYLHLGALERLVRGDGRAGEHDARLGADRRRVTTPAVSVRASWPRRLVTEQDGGRAVDDARAVAGVVHVLDPFDLRIALHGHRVEPEVFPHLLERGGEAARSARVVPGRMCSSRSSMVTPMTSLTGTIDF